MRRTLPFIPLFLLCFGASALGSEGGGGEFHGFSLKEHGYYILNFVLFVGLLVLLVREPLRKTLKERSDRFARSLDEARVRFETAESALREAQGKIAGLEAEKQQLEKRLEEEAEQVRKGVEERAASEAEKVKRLALAALANEKARMEKQLKRELAMEALHLVEVGIAGKVKTLPQQRFVRSFVQSVESELKSGGRA